MVYTDICVLFDSKYFLIQILNSSSYVPYEKPGEEKCDAVTIPAARLPFFNYLFIIEKCVCLLKMFFSFLLFSKLMHYNSKYAYIS